MSCRTALISVGLSWAVGMVRLVLLLEGVGVGVVEVVEAPPFMLRSVGPARRGARVRRGTLSPILGARGPRLSPRLYP